MRACVSEVRVRVGVRVREWRAQSAAPATKSALRGSQSTAPAAKSALRGSQRTAPATKSDTSRFTTRCVCHET